ncbi:MAG: winged helix-turn-helix transcriptional regulator [Candidatus Delongbacteria bacterium]|nr:winged helix-turn-helix transcriptional regulator [Candidatus Delongbacteria bacterium]
MQLTTYVAITKALSDPSRVRLLAVLDQSERCVCYLIDLLGLAPSTVSRHLAVLKQAGLVAARRDGKWIYYRLNDMEHNSEVDRLIRLSLSIMETDPILKTDRIRFKPLFPSDRSPQSSK